jgi:hypothetical protein
MFNKIKEFFTVKPAKTVAEVPYKVEAIVDTADIAIAQLPTPVAEQAVQAVVESIAPAQKAPAKKTTTKKAPAAKKPRAKKTPKSV